MDELTAAEGQSHIMLRQSYKGHQAKRRERKQHPCQRTHGAVAAEHHKNQAHTPADQRREL